MIRRNTWLHLHRGEVYMALVVFMMLGLACSKILLSLCLLTYAFFFLLFGDYKEFVNRFKENRVWLGLLLFFLFLHVLSCLWSTDLSAAWNGIRVRLSAVAIPLLITTTLPWKKQHLITLFKGFLMLLTLLMTLNIIRFIYLIDQQEMHDIRQLSWFGSHIRFGILVSLAIGISWYLFSKRHLHPFWALSFIALATAYTVYSQTFSAILSLGVVVVYILMDLCKNFAWKWMLILGCASAGILIAVGIVYDFQTPAPPCGSFPNVESAARAWQNKSKLNWFGKDGKGQILQRTCERYLCSKGKALKPVEIERLSSRETKDIELGFTDIHSANGNIIGRYNELKFQFQHPTNPNGHTLLQRLIYWKSGFQIIKDNVLFGVGIGDLESSLKEVYKQTILKKEYQKRPHNMFLTTWMACGILGVLSLVLCLIHFVYLGVYEKSYLSVIFALILVVTMMLEDSLETQVGSAFFGLFAALFCGKEAMQLWSNKNY